MLTIPSVASVVASFQIPVEICYHGRIKKGTFKSLWGLCFFVMGRCCYSGEFSRKGYIQPSFV